jgi:hypothetical protein
MNFAYKGLITKIRSTGSTEAYGLVTLKMLSIHLKDLINREFLISHRMNIVEEIIKMVFMSLESM